MANSYAQNASLTCPQCGRPFDAEIWLIVDVSERPDLADKMRSGSLHEVACPSCGHTGQIDAPVLVLLAHDGTAETTSVDTTDGGATTDVVGATGRSPLLFSPAQNTTADQDREHAAGLVTTLAQRMGAAWQDAWVAEGLRMIARNLLPAALSENPDVALQEAAEKAAAEIERLRQENPAAYAEFTGAVKQASDDAATADPFLVALAALAGARSPADFLRVARDHPLLLEQEGAIRVHEDVNGARRRGEAELAENLENRYEALCQVIEAIRADGLTVDQALEVAEQMEA